MPAPAIGKVRQQCLRGGDLRGQININDVAIDLHRRFQRPAALGDARIGEGEVDAALPATRLGGRISQSRLVTHIESEDQALTAILCDLRQPPLVPA